MPAVPAISILTPVWNGLPYIKECIESVLSQDFQDWEMIIGDNDPMMEPVNTSELSLIQELKFSDTKKI